jgi:DNA-binding transcriptional MerR regulator
VSCCIQSGTRLAGVTQAAVHRWEREGLIQPRRTAGGHRAFTAADVDRLRRIDYLRRFERLNTSGIRRGLNPSNAANTPTPLSVLACALCGRR